MPKLTYDIWIKRYNDNQPLTSINLCVQSEIYERDREIETCVMGRSFWWERQESHPPS
jgi:hypothetical protein